jgi:hypothetical protein
LKPRAPVPLRGGATRRCSATPKGARNLVAGAAREIILELTAGNSAIEIDAKEDQRLLPGIRSG